MSPTTTLKGLFLIILAHAQISIACKQSVLFLTPNSFSHFKKWLLTISFDVSNVHGNNLNGTIPRALRRLESMTNLWVGSLIVQLCDEYLIKLGSFRNIDLISLINIFSSEFISQVYIISHYFVSWPSSGISLATIFKVLFLLNYLELVIWILCKYWLFLY